MRCLAVHGQWHDVSHITPLAAVFGPEWEIVPTPPAGDPRWRRVFGGTPYATRLIHTLAHTYAALPLGTVAATLRAHYTQTGRVNLRRIGAAGVAAILAALGETPVEIRTTLAADLASALHGLAARAAQGVTLALAADLTTLAQTAHDLARANEQH